MKKPKGNIFLINAVMMTLVISFCTILFLTEMRTQILHLAQQREEEAMRTLRQLLQGKENAFRVADGKLLAGNRRLNGDHEIPDRIHEIFGGTAIIYLGDIAVSTSVLTPEGTRAVGARMHGPEYDAVFVEKRPYRGEASILGTPCFTAYDPIRDSSGKVIGAAFVALSKTDFVARCTQLEQKIVAGSIAIEVVFIVVGFSVLFQRNRYESRLRELADTLQGQLGFLQTLIDTIPSPIFYKDRAGHYLGHNEAFEKYIGLKREQLVGKTVWEIAPGDLAQRYYEMDEQLFLNPGVQVYDASVVYADGVRHDVVFNKATFCGRDGEVAGLVGVILDVTERRKAEQALAEREQFLSCIIDSTQDGISIHDQDLNIRSVNPVIEKRFADKMPITGRKCHEVYRGRQEPCRGCPSFETMRTGNPERRVFSRLENGRETWLELSFFPLFDCDKTSVTGFIEYIRDVTDAKRAEDSLKESEERFHQLFVQNLDATILFGADDFGIIDANPKAEELTGYSLAELTGLTPGAIIRDLDMDLLCRVSGSEAAAAEFQQEKGVCLRKDGSTIFVTIWCNVITLQDKSVVHCSIRDITDKIRLEEKVRATQAKLIHANKMASLGLLTSSVAHEINNPNNCISVNARMLTDVWRDAEVFLQMYHEEHGDFTLRGLPFAQMRQFVPQLFNGITESSNRITSIINNMKNCLRDDKSGMEGSFDVNAVVQGASSLLWHHILSHSRNYRLDLQEGLPHARGNGQQIGQVVMNLLVNALQSLPGKDAGVFVGTSTEEGGVVVITVRDEGGGIGESELARLREPFFTTRPGGTGLGLYISAAIIEEHQGTMEFESAAGKGTTVTVRLPVHRRTA